ncbi:MAG: ATP-binding protein [Deltaproteobacteria bacterium]|nr:ATP-binding protein [Deltaproteobacteria bacterium]
MLTEPTLEKMKELGLYGMAEAFIEQQKSSASDELSFEERLALLIDAEWIVRHNKRLTRRLKEAKLRISSACTEDVETSPERGLDKGTLLRLASCSFVVDKMPYRFVAFTIGRS